MSNEFRIIHTDIKLRSMANVINKIFKGGHAYTEVIWYLASATYRDNEFFVLPCTLAFT